MTRSPFPGRWRITWLSGWDQEYVDLKVPGHVTFANGRAGSFQSGRGYAGVVDGEPEQALRHYEIGAAIGDLALGPMFRDALPRGLIDNRPYLRCLHGKRLVLWGIGRMQDAAAIFQKLLWLNPGDNQGARFCLAAVEDGKAWEP